MREYNETRLHGALGYVTPLDKLLGNEQEIFASRDRKLQAARERRAENRRRQNQADRCYTEDAWAEDRATVRTDPSADPGPGAKSSGDTPPCFLPENISLSAECDKPQGVWGTGPPMKEH